MSEPGRIAFVCAMPMELRPLARKLSLRRTRLDGITAHTGGLADRQVVAVATGMGTTLARERTERLLDTVAVDRVVVVGITGAIDNETPIGTLVVPEVVVDGATGAEHRPSALGDMTPHGKMWTTDRIIGDSGALAELRVRGVVSLDMETAAIGAACERRRTPWSVFRAISDRATDGSVDEEVFGLSRQDGTPNRRAIVHYLVARPGRIPGMVRLARGAKLATETAADAAIHACSLTS